MAYQKTAKDKAWDVQRTKLRVEASMWQNRYNVENARCEYLTRQNQILESRVRDLEEAISKLTNGKMSADEAVESLRSSAKIGERAAFLMSHSSFGSYI